MTLLELILLITLTVLGISMMLALIRLILGPTLPDRVIALEVITFIVIGMVASYSIYTGETSFLDVAVIISLISFLAIVAVAYYLEKRIQ